MHFACDPETAALGLTEEEISVPGGLTTNGSELALHASLVDLHRSGERSPVQIVKNQWDVIDFETVSSFEAGHVSGPVPPHGQLNVFERALLVDGFWVLSTWFRALRGSIGNRVAHPPPEATGAEAPTLA
jgi:hypothetical protein